MSDADNPAQRVAEAIEDLGEQTRNLVRTEMAAARREMWDKARHSGPAVALLGMAGVLGVFSLASAFRMATRLFERLLPPGAAALVAALAFGGAAGWAATEAAKRLHDVPLPVPTGTARATAEEASAAVTDAEPHR